MMWRRWSVYLVLSSLLVLAVSLSFVEGAGRMPSQVTGLSLSKAVSSNLPALQANWTIPQSDVPISWYILQYRKLDDTSWGHQVTISGSTVNSTIVTRLAAGTEYRVRVKAVSDAGHGMWSALQTERTYMRAPHPDIRNVRAMAISRSAIRVSWNVPTVLNGELPITGYSIQCKVRSEKDNIKILMVQSSPAEVTGLLPGTEYRVHVASINAVGTGKYCCNTSTTVDVGTHKATSQPTVRLVNSTLQSLSISWSVTSPQDVTNYMVFWWKESAEISKSIALIDTEFVIEGLLSNTAYHVVVLASGPLGNMNSTTELFYTPPKQIQGSLRVLVFPNQVLQVSWKPPEDAGQSAIEYIVNTTMKGMEFANSTSVKHPITSVPISGLPQYSSGTVSVWAKNPGAMSKPVVSRFRMVNIVTNVSGVSAEWFNYSFTSLRVSLPGGSTHRITYTSVNETNATEPKMVTTSSISHIIEDFRPDWFYTILVETGSLDSGKAMIGSIGIVEGNNVATVGSFLGGLVAGGVCVVLVEGIVLGLVKLRRQKKGVESVQEEQKKTEATYDTVGPKESAALSEHVAMENNPAYASVQ